jgi:hypothetical protein
MSPGTAVTMSSIIDSHAIAARVRTLIGGCERGKFEATAERLGVSELALRLSVDDLSPYPTLDVLAAVVREYGVDPCWLIYGEYDSMTHRAAVDDGRRVTASNLLRLATSPRRASTDESLPLESTFRLDPVSKEPASALESTRGTRHTHGMRSSRRKQTR